MVRYADKIAYMNHDIEDAIRGGILTEEDLPWEVRLRFGSGKKPPHQRDAASHYSAQR